MVRMRTLLIAIRLPATPVTAFGFKGLVEVHLKTKGALIWEFNQPWSIEEIEIGDPVKDEVKIQMEASGMCHSDHHLVTGGIPMAGFPVLGGHEGAGIVTEVGPGVEDLAPGDHVVLSFIPSCGTCPTCQAGMRNLCDLGAGLLGGAAVPTARSASRPAARTSSR